MGNPRAIQSRILAFNGPVVPARGIYKDIHISSAEVQQQMKHLEQDNMGRYYVHRQQKVFSKESPLYVNDEKLNQYGMTKEEYSRIFTAPNVKVLNREELIDKAPNKNDIRAMLRVAADVEAAAPHDAQGNDHDAAQQQVQIG